MYTFVPFDAVTAGDDLAFDTPTSRRGSNTRTGTVVAVSQRAVTVDCADGTRAIVRRADWMIRNPRRKESRP